VYAYTGEPSLNANSHTLKPDRLQHDRPAACVIAQQYSSVTFISLFFHSHKEKYGERSENVIILIFFKIA
jgi:hypothetical protein